MDVPENEPDIRSLADEKIQLGQSLLGKLKSYQHINGVNKIEKKILQEIKFLQKVNNNNRKKCTENVWFSAFDT